MKTYCHNGIRLVCNEDAACSFNMVRPHFHEEYELYYLLSGTRLFFVKDRVYPMVAGCLAFVDGEEMHRVFSKSDKPHKRFIVCIQKSRLQREFPGMAALFADGGCIALSVKQQTRIQALIGQLVEECNEDRLMKHEYIELLVRQFLLEVLRQRHVPSQEIHYGGENILKILHYIDEHYAEKITLGQLCAYLNVSTGYLTRIFKASTGYTLVEYINNLRIKKAAELLANTALPVSQIALETGFSGFSYFGKLFTACYGVSPLQYRKQSRL